MIYVNSSVPIYLLHLSSQNPLVSRSNNENLPFTECSIKCKQSDDFYN